MDINKIIDEVNKKSRVLSMCSKRVRGNIASRIISNQMIQILKDNLKKRGILNIQSADYRDLCFYLNLGVHTLIRKGFNSRKKDN